VFIELIKNVIDFREVTFQINLPPSDDISYLKVVLSEDGCNREFFLLLSGTAILQCYNFSISVEKYNHGKAERQANSI
jgi:hypothetical protein